MTSSGGSSLRGREDETLRLRRFPLEVDTDPWRAALALRGDPHPFALSGRWAGGGAVLGSCPVRLAAPTDDPFATLAAQPSVDVEDGEGAVGGGWVGFLGYGLGGRVEPVPPGPPRPVPLPAFALAFYDHVLRQDPAGRWWFEALWTPARDAALRARRDDLRRRLAALAADAREPLVDLGPFAPAAPGAAGHLAAVAACRERIAAGELFQANLCLRLEAAWRGAPEALYARAAAALRPDRAALVAGPWGALVSLSPELFLARHGREVRTAPIKGTAPSDAGEALARSQKDRAENVMIADLMRNDLGRVCAYGSVRVEALAEPRAHAGVWHLVSEVRGTLREGAGDDALLRACFPPGSVTGAPKVRAQRVIAELEATGREAYTGAIGFASPVAGLELSVAIRTFELRGDRAWLGVGGGVTWGSDPAAELEECLVKARPLLAAAGTALAAGLRARAGAAQRPSRLATPPAALELAPDAARPDPALGVFTTVLVHDGRPVRLGEHLARLGTSVAALGGPPLPAGLAERAATDAASIPGGAGRLRLAWSPADPGEVAVTTGPPPPPVAAAFRLAPVTLTGGLGAHKWGDRRLLGALTARLRAVPLITDADGHVLEAAWAAVLILEDDRLVAPPEDGRLLASTARARVAADAQALGLAVRHEPLTLERLAASDTVLLASALRGPLPAALAGTRPRAPAPAAVELAAAWQRGVGRSSGARWSTSKPSSSASSSPSPA